MVEMKVGSSGVEFTSDTSDNHDPYLIGVFGNEHVGKTRLPLTGPDGVGCVITEMKSYVTVDALSQEYGKRVFKPKNPYDLTVSMRTVEALHTDLEKQKFFQKRCRAIEESVYGLLEHAAVNIVMIDKFSHYCTWKTYATYGMEDNFVKVQGQVRKSTKEAVDAMMSFMNALSQFGKPVVFLCATQDDYDFVGGPEKKPLRKTWDCRPFKALGSHCNVVVELIDNPRWTPGSADERLAWHYRLNVRRCQKRAQLEGPDGNPLLSDDDITLTNMVMYIDPDMDVEAWS